MKLAPSDLRARSVGLEDGNSRIMRGVRAAIKLFGKGECMAPHNYEIRTWRHGFIHRIRTNAYAMSAGKEGCP